ncbi:unnamed protein product, partial [Symbiodinium sp. CCMP2592]
AGQEGGEQTQAAAGDLNPPQSEDADLQALQNLEEATVQHGLGFASFADLEDGAEAKKAAKNRGKKRKQPLEEEAAASEEDMMAGDNGAEYPPDVEQADDKDMVAITKRHFLITGKEAPCLWNLQAERILKGEKLGKSVQGAKSCLKTLVAHKAREQHELHDRIARAEAAMSLMGEPLRAIPNASFLKLIMVLREDLPAAPFDLRISITGKLVQDQLNEAVQTTDRKEALQLVEVIAKRIVFPVSAANSESGVVRKVQMKPCDVQQPSFAPLLEDVMKQASSVSTDDVDLDLFGEETEESGQGKEQKGESGLESHIKALAAEILECLVSDTMIDLFCKLVNEDHQRLLLTFFKSFLSSLQTNPSWDELLGFPCMQPVRDAVTSFKRFASCVHELVQADHEVRSFEALQYFLKYKGTSPWERTICNILTKPERKDAADDEKHARAFLLDLAEDALKTSASTLKFEPTFLVCMQKLKAQVPSIPDLKFAAENLSSFKEGLRKGRALSMEPTLVHKLSAVAASVYQSKTCEDIASEDVDSLLALLKSYSQHSICFDASNLLVQWATKHNCRLHQEALSRVLGTYLKQVGESPEKVSLFEVMPLDDIKALTRKARPPTDTQIPEPLRGRLLEATVHLLQLSVHEANAHLDETIRGAPHLANVARAFAMLAGHAHAKATGAMFEFVSAVSQYRLAERIYAARGGDAEERAKNDAKHASLIAAVEGIGKVRETFASMEKALGPESGLPDIDLSDLAAVRHSPEQAVLCVNFKHFVAGERSILKSEVLSDAVSFAATKKGNDMRSLMASLDKESAGFAGDKSWKDTLSGDADLAQVLEAYETVLKPVVQSSGLKSKLDELLEGVTDARDFADRVNRAAGDLMNDELRALGDECTEATKMVRAGGAIFTEIVLSVALKSMKERASDLQAVQKAKGLVSGQVSPLRTGSNKYAVGQEDIHPVLYEQAVAAMQ